MSLGLRSSLARSAYAFRSRPRLGLLGPAALWALLALAALLLRQPSGAWRLYLFALPLVAVLILAGGLVDDPAAELLMTLPVPAWRRLAERSLAGLALLLLHAAAFRLLVLALGGGGGWAGRPALGWALGGALALAAASMAVAFLAAREVAGAGFGTAVWLAQAVFGAALTGSRPGRDLYLFLAVVVPWGERTARALLENQLVLWGVTLLGAALAALAQRYEERLLPRNVD